MRIAILKESLCLGGTERSAANTSKVLGEQHEVYLVLYDGSNIKYSYKGELVDFKQPAKKTILSKIINNLFRIWKYKRLIRQKEFDILYEFIAIKNPLSRLKHKQICIISARDFSAMSTYPNRFNQCLKNADAMICNSKYIKEYFLSHFPEQEENVFTVYNYIDNDEIQEQGQEVTEILFSDFISTHSSTIVSVGRFCKEKGFEYLIESFAIARKNNDSIGLVLVGDGDYKSKYNDIIERFKLKEHVYMTGFQKNPYKYMRQCDVFVLSSVSEGFPNVLAEGMALGLPVIAVNCRSGPAEILREDGNYNAVSQCFEECDYGIISPQMTEENNDNAIAELALAINFMLTNEDKRQKYAALSKERASTFSKDTMLLQLNKIFSELMQRKDIK